MPRQQPAKADVQLMHRRKAGRLLVGDAVDKVGSLAEPPTSEANTNLVTEGVVSAAMQRVFSKEPHTPVTEEKHTVNESIYVIHLPYSFRL